MSDGVFLAELFHHRWAVPLLAELWTRRGGGRGRGGRVAGGRVVELTNGLGGSRGGVRQALASLVDLGFIARNTGHGHPLRPEYLLTERGRRIAAEAEQIVALARRWSIREQTFRKWSLPVVYGLGEEGARFSELRSELPGITDRALSTALRTLRSARLVERMVRPTRPPAVKYLPTDRAGPFLPPLRRLARAA